MIVMARGGRGNIANLKGGKKRRKKKSTKSSGRPFAASTSMSTYSPGGHR
ncbi:hypothetical protein [Streptomyces noursei]